MSKVAAIDLGTNSFLCLIAERGSKEPLRIIEDICEIVRLGEGVQLTGKFSEEALFRADACLKKFKARIEFHNVSKVLAVATSAARDVKNGNLLIELGKKNGIPIQIIDGYREADLTYKGVLTGKNNDLNFIVVDIGGGSTEFAYIQNDKLFLKSLNIGCVRLTEKYLSTNISTQDQISKLQAHIKKELVGISVSGPQEMVAVAGTPTTLAAVKKGQAFDASWVENSILTTEDLEKMAGLLNSKDLEERKQIPGIEPKRADVLLSGCIILRMIAEALGFKKMRVSTRGIRYGLAQELLNE